jgi:hypothetical protein
VTLFLKPGAISFGKPAAINPAPAVLAGAALAAAKQVSFFIRLFEGFCVKDRKLCKGLSGI